MGSENPTVLRVRPSNLGVITYYVVGFGDTGRIEALVLGVCAVKLHD